MTAIHGSWEFLCTEVDNSHDILQLLLDVLFPFPLAHVVSFLPVLSPVLLFAVLQLVASPQPVFAVLLVTVVPEISKQMNLIYSNCCLWNFSQG